MAHHSTPRAMRSSTFLINSRTALLAQLMSRREVECMSSMCATGQSTPHPENVGVYETAVPPPHFVEGDDEMFAAMDETAEWAVTEGAGV